jgi:hypothetical protein
VRAPRFLACLALAVTVVLAVAPIGTARGAAPRDGGGPRTHDQWMLLLEDDFEFDFPDTVWSLRFAPGAPWYWDEDAFNPGTGSFSAWCAERSTGAPDREASTDVYPNNMNAMMFAGPFDLSDAVEARVIFSYWNLSDVGDSLYFLASGDSLGLNVQAPGSFRGEARGGDSGGWVRDTLDLANVPGLGSLLGDSTVYIGFRFSSDASGALKGAFIDDVDLSKLADPNPIISHTPVFTATQGTAIPITATMTDDDPTIIGKLHYRMLGAQAFTDVDLTRNVNTFTAQIPASAVTERGLEYYLEGTDGSGFSFYPAAGANGPLWVPVSITSATPTTPQPGGSEQNAYRMISVPVEASPRSVSALLFDDLGTYNHDVWRFFRWESNRYTEYSPDSAASAEITPGKAYWLIVRDPNHTIDVESGTSATPVPFFNVVLEPGWNDIGVPWAFPVSWADVQVNRPSIEGPYLYEGTWIPPAGVSRLDPWKGYAIRNITSSPINLAIPSRSATGTAPALATSEASRGATGLIDDPTFGSGWRARFEARCEDALDAWNVVGWSDRATPEKDPFDFSEPPPIGQYVSLSFLVAEAGGAPRACTNDLRPRTESGAQWTMTVENGVRPGARVTVGWEGFDRLPSELDAALLDPTDGVAVDPRSATSYAFRADARRELVLVVGPREYVEAHARRVTIPAVHALLQNQPNPFRPGTEIRYQLASAAAVRLAVFDAQGRQVRTLVDGTVAAGHHRVAWDGRDAHGRAVPSGLYFYRLVAGAFTATRKMVLSR